MVGPFGADDPAPPGAGDIRWPAGLSPGWSDVWAYGEVAVEAAPGLIFALLITPGRWEHDFSVIRKVRVAPPGGAALGPDSEFEFETNELRLYAQVIEFVADSRLAWSGQGTDISAYQAWVISGQATTPQVRAGFAARGAAAIALRETSVGGAQRTLDRWLADLRIAAETG